jgi:hypothetical protein
MIFRQHPFTGFLPLPAHISQAQQMKKPGMKPGFLFLS